LKKHDATIHNRKENYCFHCHCKLNAKDSLNNHTLNHLQAYFVDRQDMTRIKLKFVYANTASLVKAIDFFEMNKVQMHNAKEKMESILYIQLKKIVQSRYLEDEEEDEVIKKRGVDLLQVEVSEKTVLKREKIELGKDVSDEIKAMGLGPTSPKIGWLMDMAKRYHMEVCKYLIKYFATGIKSSTLDYMAGLSPASSSKKSTPRKVKALADKYSKVVDNIQFIGGMDQLKEELNSYSVDDDVKELQNLDYEEFWEEVASLTIGGEEWARYKVLPRFALAMATKHNDTSEVERKFSVMSHIHQNTQRNRMGQDMLDSQCTEVARFKTGMPV